MAKTELKGATLLAPLPAVMVSVANGDKPNIITVAWTGIVCSQPPRVYVSVRHDRYSYDLIKNAGDYVINVTTDKLLPCCDYCGIRSGRDVDKFAELGLTAEKSSHVTSPMISQSPINLECKVFDVIPLGSHDMFLADVVALHVDNSLMDENGKINYSLANLVNYQHGEYYATGKHLGRFGFATQRKFIAKHGKGVAVDVHKATLTKRKPCKKSK